MWICLIGWPSSNERCRRLTLKSKNDVRRSSRTFLTLRNPNEVHSWLWNNNGNMRFRHRIQLLNSALVITNDPPKPADISRITKSKTGRTKWRSKRRNNIRIEEAQQRNPKSLDRMEIWEGLKILWPIPTGASRWGQVIMSRFRKPGFKSRWTELWCIKFENLVKYRKNLILRFSNFESYNYQKVYSKLG